MNITERFTSKVKKINVNSDLLAGRIDDYVNEAFGSMFFMDLRTSEDREAFAETIEYFLSTLYENDEVVTFKVVFDKRNNKRAEMSQGIYHIDIMYQQKNCLNVTTLQYSVTQTFDEIEHIRF